MTDTPDTVSVELTPSAAVQVAVAAEIGLLHVAPNDVHPGDVRAATLLLRQAAAPVEEPAGAAPKAPVATE